MSLVVLMLWAVAAQGGAQAQQAGVPRTRPQPAVDPLTAMISGRVTTADSGAPVRGAEVRTVSDGGVNRLAATDADGRFELRDLPAGTFRIAVSKSGFVPLQFGQRRPGEAATEIALSQGESFTANVALLRGGVIAGRAFDRFGEPVAGVRVQALRPRMVEGRRRLQPAGAGDETDDTGSFRVYGLAPGDYYVIARPPQANQFPVKGSAPIYFPGTVDFSEAQRITVAAAAESNAMIQMVPIGTATVSGTVIDSTGAPVEAMVNLTSENVGLGYVNAARGEVPFTISGHAGADGTFAIAGVPPGAYSLDASFSLRAIDVTGELITHQMASVPVAVSGNDVGGLTVALSGGGTITGTIVRDAGVTRPLPEGIGVRVTGGRHSMMNTGPNGTFRLAGAVGPLRLSVEGLPDGWVVKSIDAGGADVTDTPIQVGTGRTMAVRVVVTDRVTEVSGTVASGTPGQSVVVFADDRTKWAYPSRFVQAARLGDGGTFSIEGLPPGERYLAAVVDFLEEGDTQDAEILERLRSGAVAFTLSEGERRMLELRTPER